MNTKTGDIIQAINLKNKKNGYILFFGQNNMYPCAAGTLRGFLGVSPLKPVNSPEI
jgi:hypothetical protein